MGIIEEIIGQIFQWVIIRFFGYYSLFLVYYVTRNKNGLRALKKIKEGDEEELHSNCLITFSGLVSIVFFFFLVGWVLDFLGWLD